MGDDKEKLEIAVSAPGEWVLQKVFGPTLNVIGRDLSELYAKGRDRIIAATYKKIKDVNDDKQANLRVTRDVLWNGAFADNEICAEYFGGIMASSRSEDGSDDSAVQFVDVTKSLSTKQLYLHYVIYNSLNKLLVASGAAVNVALDSEIENQQVWFPSDELRLGLDLSVERDLNVLLRHGLLRWYNTTARTVGVLPTTFGVLLYASAHNLYDEWLQFDRLDFGDFEGIKLPILYSASRDVLLDRTGMTDAASREPPESRGGRG